MLALVQPEAMSLSRLLHYLLVCQQALKTQMRLEAQLINLESFNDVKGGIVLLQSCQPLHLGKIQYFLNTAFSSVTRKNIRYSSSHIG